jgi:hypothetical protein
MTSWYSDDESDQNDIPDIDSTLKKNKFFVLSVILRFTASVIIHISYRILLERNIYKFPGEYCLNVSKQLEYKIKAYIF